MPRDRLPAFRPQATGDEVVAELLRLFDGRRADVLRIVQHAGRFWDLAAQAQAQVEADGVFVQGRYGVTRHPGVTLEREARRAFIACVQVLRQPPPRGKTGRRTNEEQVADGPAPRPHRYIRPA